MSFKVFQVEMNILKSVLSRIGSQWRSFSIGVMRSNFLVFVKIRAAAFWASWSFRSKRPEMPVRREFQLSKRDVISAWMIVAAVESVKIFLILFTFLMWKYTDWHIRLACWSIHKSLSKAIPKCTSGLGQHLCCMLRLLTLRSISLTLILILTQNAVSVILLLMTDALFALLHNIK